MQLSLCRPGGCSRLVVGTAVIDLSAGRPIGSTVTPVAAADRLNRRDAAGGLSSVLWLLVHRQGDCPLSSGGWCTGDSGFEVG